MEKGRREESSSRPVDVFVWCVAFASGGRALHLFLGEPNGGCCWQLEAVRGCKRLEPVKGGTLERLPGHTIQGLRRGSQQLIQRHLLPIISQSSSTFT